MKFDVIVMNPPYQGATGTNNTLWNKFVDLVLSSLLKDNGYLAAIHPSGWRDAYGDFKYIQTELTSREMEYLETHDRFDGFKLFGAQTSYDWYVVKNTENKTKKQTIILCRDNTRYDIDISSMGFIPNGKIEEIKNIIAKNNEERCDVLYSRYSYGSDKIWMSKNKNNDFVYPCIYTILKKGIINLRWSNTNGNGHFGLPKVIWSNGTSMPIVDSEGEYGLTEFAYAIIDSVENLENIKKAMESNKFIELMEQCQLIGKHRYHGKAISLFRKDFWKEFVE